MSADARAWAAARMACIPYAASRIVSAKVEERTTSMCMQIAGFDHDDCPGEWCACSCHKEAS